MTPSDMIEHIKVHADILEYKLWFEVVGGDVEIFSDYAHGIAFYAKIINGHIQVYQYQGRADKSEDDYGKHSIYSIRNKNDLMDFCTILSSSARIRAGRKED